EGPRVTRPGTPVVADLRPGRLPLYRLPARTPTEIGFSVSVPKYSAHGHDQIPATRRGQIRARWTRSEAATEWGSGHRRHVARYGGPYGWATGRVGAGRRLCRGMARQAHGMT